MTSEVLTTLPNRNTIRDYEVEICTDEFTCLCPGKPDQPDFATLQIIYTPQEKLIELKSLKFYLYSFRNQEIYHEDATNKILTDLVKTCAPRAMRVIADWNIRGGIKTRVTVEYP
jgi:7-cyano-7-deazaguanine reductase